MLNLICFVFLVSKNSLSSLLKKKNSLSSNEEFSSPAKKLHLFIKNSKENKIVTSPTRGRFNMHSWSVYGYI